MLITLGKMERCTWFTRFTVDRQASVLKTLTTKQEAVGKTNRIHSKVKVVLRPTVGRSVSLGIQHPFGAYDQIFITV
jgi:hypothetical protein